MIEVELRICEGRAVRLMGEKEFGKRLKLGDWAP